MYFQKGLNAYSLFYILNLVFVVCISFNSFSQNFEVSGQIVSEEDGLQIEFATVKLLKPSDS